VNREQWQAWYDAKPLLYRIHYRINMRWVRFEDWLSSQDGWLSEQDFMYQQDGWLARRLCAVLGHEPVPDQCNKPEHDYCVWCGKRMPRKVRS